jgi:hypothetical protein
VTHKHAAWAQLILTVVFVVGYFWTLRDFIHGNVKVPVEWKETLQTLLGLLSAGLLLILNFWFARQRSSTDPQ